MSEQEPTVNDPTDNNPTDSNSNDSTSNERNSNESNPSQTDGSSADGINPDADTENQGTENQATENQGQDAKETSTEPIVEIPANEVELTKVRAERDLLEQKLQRAMADTQNIRRRQRQEMDDSRRRVVEGMTQELLPVLDSFALALQAYDTAAEDGSKEQATSGLVEGVRMVKTLLSGALERHGLQEIDAIGKPFDPAHHEALGVEPNGDVDENQVLRVVQTGYLLGEHVVRHSKVIVAGPPPQD
ncbi:MAG: molecular chaperone GrpE [Planctomycetota bacterium]